MSIIIINTNLLRHNTYDVDGSIEVTSFHIISYHIFASSMSGSSQLGENGEERSSIREFINQIHKYM